MDPVSSFPCLFDKFVVVGVKIFAIALSRLEFSESSYEQHKEELNTILSLLQKLKPVSKLQE